MWPEVFNMPRLEILAAPADMEGCKTVFIKFHFDLFLVSITPEMVFHYLSLFSCSSHCAILVAMVIHNIIIWSSVMPSGNSARSTSLFSTISAHSRSCAAISLNVFFMSVIYLLLSIAPIYCPGSSSPGRFYSGHLLSIGPI